MTPPVSRAKLEAECACSPGLPTAVSPLLPSPPAGQLEAMSICTAWGSGGLGPRGRGHRSVTWGGWLCKSRGRLACGVGPPPVPPSPVPPPRAPPEGLPAPSPLPALPAPRPLPIFLPSPCPLCFRPAPGLDTQYSLKAQGSCLSCRPGRNGVPASLGKVRPGRKEAAWVAFAGGRATPGRVRLSRSLTPPPGPARSPLGLLK